MLPKFLTAGVNVFLRSRVQATLHDTWTPEVNRQMVVVCTYCDPGKTFVDVFTDLSLYQVCEARPTYLRKYQIMCHHKIIIL
jgi:hypothetical protein